MGRKDVNGEPIPCDVVVRTFNRQSKKGGRLVTYKTAKVLPLSSSKERVETIESLARVDLPAKNPNHFLNKTRNIKTADGELKKINLLFVIKVNGQFVRY